MKSVRIILNVVAAVGASLLHLCAEAATPRCVDTAGKLIQAFTDANNAVEGEPQDIRIQTGNYNIGSALTFTPDGDHDNKDFSLSGGWNVGCTSQVVNPANTVLTFTGSSEASRTVQLDGDNHSYTVQGIRFDYASLFRIYDPECGFLEICPDTDSITVQFNEFRFLKGVFISTSDAHTFAVRNNLFAKFAGKQGGDLLTIAYLNTETMPDFSFNTLAAMQCNGAALVNFYTWQSGAVLHHNIFDSSGCTHDLTISTTFGGGEPVSLRNNLYSQLGGLAPVEATDNLVNVDPGFVDAGNNDFHLRTTAPVSPAIDKGMNVVVLGLSGLSFPPHDLYGGVRLVGTNFDIGALESPGPAPTEYVVKNINDSGTDSLRDAIYKANHAAGFQKIKFAIPGGCPQRIDLATPLDDIVDDLEIDGYSQAGTAMNSASVGNNATLCVKVGPASGQTIAYSLQVPDTAAESTNLQVRGIAFMGGHTTAPVYLRGGSGHLIQGNAFGGVRPGGIDKLGDTNQFHVIVRANASGVSIGGQSNADRNYFGSSQSSAILLRDVASSGHIVRNNYIGLDPGGAVPQPIGGDGVAIVDSSYIQITGNLIDGAASGIVISGVTASNVTVRSNNIGIDAYGGQGASAANGDGIFIYGGAHFNEIGSSYGKTASNTIANNNYAGVRIDDTAGVRNTVRPNSIYNNGKSGIGLGIDLGSLGPLANDLFDADGYQNSPRLNASVPNPDTSRTISGTLNSATGKEFLVDVYRSPSCAGGDRGGDAKTFMAAAAPYGSIKVSILVDGPAKFSAVLSGVGAPAYITAIARNMETGDTSEIGACFYEDTLFKNGAEVEPL